jgi:hypothetical protein
MASMPSSRPVETRAPALVREGEVLPVPSATKGKTRAERFADAHEWVLEHHAKTFEKLAK